MIKPVIAVDIDDVLARHVTIFVEFSNQQWGTNLTTEDYDENWAKLWHVDEVELMRRADIFHRSGVLAQCQPIDGALPALRHLKQDFRLIVITSRRIQVETETLAWINQNYPDIFEEIHFAGIWDAINVKSDIMAQSTKAALCQQLGANYLIDDQFKHCHAAAESGVASLLFGDYGWNRQAVLVPGITRVIDWQAVEGYFNGIKQ